MKPFSAIAVVVFVLVAIVQLARVALSWEVVVNGVIIPVWASVVACALALVLAVMVSREARR